MNKLKGKIAVVTGGNSGIGLATAHAFIQEGAKVLITGRNKEANQKALSALGNNAQAIESDAGSVAEIQKLGKFIRQNVAPKIDILFANAGIAKFAPLTEIDEAFFDETFNINVKGVFFIIQELLPLMNNGGSIILNASIVAHKGMQNTNVYSASKAAVISLAKTLSTETLDRGIRINTISPGPINTPIYNPEKMGMSQEAIQQLAEGILSQTPMKRFGSPEEVAKLAVFLASEDSSFIVGEEIIIDGGLITL